MNRMVAQAIEARPMLQWASDLLPQRRAVAAAALEKKRELAEKEWSERKGMELAQATEKLNIAVNEYRKGVADLEEELKRGADLPTRPSVEIPLDVLERGGSKMYGFGQEAQIYAKDGKGLMRFRGELRAVPFDGSPPLSRAGRRFEEEAVKRARLAEAYLMLGEAYFLLPYEQESVEAADRGEKNAELPAREAKDNAKRRAAKAVKRPSTVLASRWANDRPAEPEDVNVTQEQIVKALLSAARSAVASTLGERVEVVWPMLESEARQAAEEAASELAALLAVPAKVDAGGILVPLPAKATETKKEARKPNVSVAQAARRDALLDARVNHNGATKTWRRLVEEGIRRGGELGVTFRTSPDLTRTAFNRMGSAEHDAWEEKQKEKGLKPVFHVGTDEEGTFVEVNKTVFEYAAGLSGKPILVRYDFGYLDGKAEAAAREATRREHESLLRVVEEHNETRSERPQVEV